MNHVQELKQAAQSAFSEYMVWHEGEQRLLTCVSQSRGAELDQEIERLRTLRRTAIAAGQTSGKEYKQLAALLTSTESERADLDIVADELEQGALDRAVAGQALWQSHRAQRSELAHAYLQEEVTVSREEVEIALTPVLPLLARLVKKLEQQQNIGTALVDHSEARQQDFSITKAVKVSPMEVVTSLLAGMIEPMLSATGSELDQEVMTEIKRCPPSNLIRGDLVGSRAKKMHHLKLQERQRESKAKPTSARQQAADLWAPENMISRREHLRDVM
ncbi:hypothetical protein D3C85_917380 [compost metagenome]